LPACGTSVRISDFSMGIFFDRPPRAPPNPKMDKN
jgi:hypothetical protein